MKNKRMTVLLSILILLQMIPCQFSFFSASISYAAEKNELTQEVKEGVTNEVTKVTVPIKSFHATTPCRGKVKALVFRVEFQDVNYNKNALSAKELKKAVFGPENTRSVFYPMESVSAYYERASYGSFHISGDIYTYKAAHKRAYYNKKQEYETLVMEVLNAYDKKIDYSQYDQNKDHYIDCLCFGVPTNGSSKDDFWHGCQATWYLNEGYQLDGVKVDDYIINDAQPYADNISEYNSVLVHEIGHSMGLPDYYKYNSDDWEGLKGEAGYERMDDAIGDFCSFSKLMYGWLPGDKVQIADLSKETGTYSITSASTGASCLLVPVGSMNSRYFSEYFLVEYLTPSQNNSGLFDEGGIRVFHVDAKTVSSIYNSKKRMFRYDNYSPYYDSSNQGIRILELVGEDRGFYQTGDTISYGTRQFGLYDGNGKAVLDPGFEIQVGDLKKGKYQITIHLPHKQI